MGWRFFIFSNYRQACAVCLNILRQIFVLIWLGHAYCQNFGEMKSTLIELSETFLHCSDLGCFKTLNWCEKHASLCKKSHPIFPFWGGKPSSPPPLSLLSPSQGTLHLCHQRCRRVPHTLQVSRTPAGCRALSLWRCVPGDGVRSHGLRLSPTCLLPWPPQTLTASPGCHLCWPVGYRSEVPTTSSWVRLICWNSSQNSGTLSLTVHRFIVKRHDKGSRWTSGWKRRVGQGMGRGLCPCSPAWKLPEARAVGTLWRRPDKGTVIH